MAQSMSSPGACKAGGLLGLRDLSQIFRGVGSKNSEAEPVFEHAWKHACGLQAGKCT